VTSVVHSLDGEQSGDQRRAENYELSGNTKSIHVPRTGTLAHLVLRSCWRSMTAARSARRRPEPNNQRGLGAGRAEPDPVVRPSAASSASSVGSSGPAPAGTRAERAEERRDHRSLAGGAGRAPERQSAKAPKRQSARAPERQSARAPERQSARAPVRAGRAAEHRSQGGAGRVRGSLPCLDASVSP